MDVSRLFFLSSGFIRAVFRDLGKMPVSKDEFMILSRSGVSRWRTDLKKMVGRVSSVQVEELRLCTVFSRVSDSIMQKLDIRFTVPVFMVIISGCCVIWVWESIFSLIWSIFVLKKEASSLHLLVEMSSGPSWGGDWSVFKLSRTGLERCLSSCL